VRETILSQKLWPLVHHSRYVDGMSTTRKSAHLYDYSLTLLVFVLAVSSSSRFSSSPDEFLPFHYYFETNMKLIIAVLIAVLLLMLASSFQDSLLHDLSRTSSYRATDKPGKLMQSAAFAETNGEETEPKTANGTIYKIDLQDQDELQNQDELMIKEQCASEFCTTDSASLALDRSFVSSEKKKHWKTYVLAAWKANCAGCFTLTFFFASDCRHFDIFQFPEARFVTHSPPDDKITTRKRVLTSTNETERSNLVLTVDTKDRPSETDEKKIQQDATVHCDG